MAWYAWGWGAFAVHGCIGLGCLAAGVVFIRGGVDRPGDFGPFWNVAFGLVLVLCGLRLVFPGVVHLWFTIAEKRERSDH